MKILYMLSIVFLAIILTGCSQNQNANIPAIGQDDDKITIVTTIFPPYDFTRAVIGDKAELTMLIKPGTEVHSYDPSPADIIKIQNADIFIYVGGENDKWVQAILDGMDVSNKKIIRLMDYVKTVEEEVVEGMQEGEKHSGHHEEITYDEHIWTSPENAILLVDAIANVICEVDSKNAEIYIQNAITYKAQIKKVSDDIQAIADNATSKLLIFADRFPFRYFAKQFGFEYRAAFSACSTEIEASAGTLAYLINTVKNNHISHVFYIEMSNQNIARAISEQTGAKPLLMHSCHNITKNDFEAGVTYLSLMEQNAKNLREGLK
ncbi:MAG: metal ABC transporter substrate-binding protein [Bacillota bacterium]|jgi:zinc transport system substrate-binding protein